MTIVSPGGGAPEADEPAHGTAARRAQQAARAVAAPPRVRRPSAPASTPGATVPRALLDPDKLAALEEQRDFLLRSLDDLEREHDAGDVDDADYEALVDDYTARAAEVLRAIDERRTAFTAARRPRTRGRSLGIGALVVVAALGLGVFVARSSGERGAGDTLSGDIRQTTRDQLLQAQQLGGEGKLVDAIKLYDDVLAAQPANVEALAYKGWLLRLTAREVTDTNDRDVLLAKALDLLDQAIRADAGYADARVFRASLLREIGQPAQALADLDTLKPDSIPVFLQTRVEDLRTRIQQDLAATTGTTPGTTPRPG